MTSKRTRNMITNLNIEKTSDWIHENFQFDGKTRKGQLRFTLITVPNNFANEVIAKSGSYFEVDNPWAYLNSWLTFEIYLE